MDKELKCPHCGGYLRLEDEVCSYCGLPNRYGAPYRRIRADYIGKASELKERSKRTRTVTGIVVFLSALLLALLIATFVSYRERESLWLKPYETRELEAEEQYEECAAMIDGFLLAEDFEAVGEVAELYDIDYTNAFEEYRLIFEQVYAYRMVCSYCRDLAYEPDVRKYDDGAGNRLGDYLNDFYENYDPGQYRSFLDEPYAIDKEKTLRARDAMERDIRCMLSSFLRLKADDLDRLSTMRESERKALIEEAFYE